MDSTAKQTIIAALNQQFKRTAISAACELPQDPLDAECLAFTQAMIEAHNLRADAVKAAVGQGVDNAERIITA